MIVIRPTRVSAPAKGCVATIGVFDGVHAGHRFLLDEVKREAVARGLRTMAVTFDAHPATVTGNGSPQVLNTTDEKLALLEETGIDECLVVPFTPELAALTAVRFMQMLHQQHGVEVLVMGHDHRFGCEQCTDRRFYTQQGELCGMTVVHAERYGEASSSTIRLALKEGHVEQARTLLGRPYSLQGPVVDGYKMGRKLGFPTANVAVAPEKLLPKEGVYAVRVRIGNATDTLRGLMNIGPCPTFEGKNERHPEVHILDWQGDIYAETLCVELISRLRDEQKFDSVEQLVSQLKTDVTNVRNIDIS